MQFNRKILLVPPLVSLFVFSPKNSCAQYPGMATFRAQQNRQFVNQQMQTQMQMMNMRGVQSTMEEFDFEVTLRDSTKTKVTSAIYTDTTTRKRFIVLVDKKYKKSDTNRYKKIYPSQTLDLVCVLIQKNEDNETPGSYLPGKPTDSCWMFKAISGRISAYSYLIFNDTSPINQSYIIGIQLNDGPILKFNEDNLKTMVGQDAKALKLVENKKYIRAITKYNKESEAEN